MTTTVPPRRLALPWVKLGGLLALLIALAYLVTVRALFIPLVAAVAIDATLAPIVAALERRDWPHRLAVLAVFSGFAAMTALGLAVAPRVVAAEIATIRATWPENRPRLVELLRSTQDTVNQWTPPAGQVDLVAGVPDRLRGYALDLLAAAPQSMPDVIMALLLVPLFTFFLMRDGADMKRAVVAAVPNRYFEMTLSIMYRVNRQVSNYLRGLLVEAGTDTIIATALCAALGLPNPVLLGLMAGVTAVIPLAGIVFAAVAVPLIAIFSAPGDPLVVAGLALLAIVVTHTVDNVLVAPLVIGHSVNMHPVAVIVSILIAGRLFGLLGIVLALPVTSILVVIAQEGYRGIKANEYYLTHT